MPIRIRGAAEHNLRGIDIDIHEGLTAITGVSGSGKSSLVFDTLYHEARRRFLDIYSLQSSSLRLNPAQVESIDGLLPAVAVAQNVLNRNPASTVATASGIHPFLRLLYANYGTRFCSHCGESVAISDNTDLADHLVRKSAAGEIPVRAVLLRGVKGSHRALLSMLGKELTGYTLYVDGRTYKGDALDPAQTHDIAVEIAKLERGTEIRKSRGVVNLALELGSLLLEVGDEIRPLAPVCTNCGDWIRDVSQTQFHRPCPYCGGEGCQRCDGTGMHPEAAATRWEGYRIDELLALHVSEFIEVMKRAEAPSSAKRLVSEIVKRTNAIYRLGLGYLTLNRISPSLSRGEAQRLRLSVCLASNLELLHVLDEPSIGLHPTDVGNLFCALRNLKGPVVYVEHEREAAAAADYCIDVGPKAGGHGGKLVYQGDSKGLWSADTISGRFFSLRERVVQPVIAARSEEFIEIRGAGKNNLRDIDVRLPLGRMTVVTGVSGSGKTSLVQGVLAASFKDIGPAYCDAVDSPPMKCVHVDQGPIGKNPRSNPATYTKLADIVRDVFASLTGLSASFFSFNRKEGACEACKGLGAEEIIMRYLPSTWVTCPVCQGHRYSDDVLAASVVLGGERLTIADMYNRSVEEVAKLFLTELDENPGIVSASKHRQARAVIQAMIDIGLGYLPLGQPSPTLSGGEAQRIKLTKFLGKRDLNGQLLILDEPSTGLHPADVAGLLSIFSRLTRQGTTLVVVEHNQDVVRAADWIVDLGPGAGPTGGSVVYQGPVAGIISCNESRTGKGLRAEEKLKPGRVVSRGSPTGKNAIEIKRASINNLHDVSARIPKGSFTVVTGVSGSGKSSLVSGVLETEARRRYLETLSMYERQSVREAGGNAAAEIDGLGVTVAVNPARGRYNLRSTVGTTSEIISRLSLLFAVSPERICVSCGAEMTRSVQWECPQCGTQDRILPSRHFFRNSYSSACKSCHGVGSHRKFNWRKLIVRPDLPLCGGAMHSPGFFPKGYLCKPFNGGYDEVRALARKYGFDPESTPWNEISKKAQDAFLYGEKEPLEVEYRSRKGRVYTSMRSFHGFFRWIGDWDIGGTYTDTESCADCSGSGLRPASLAVKLGGFSIHELSEMPLSRLEQILSGLSVPAGSPRSLISAHQTAQKRAGFLVRAGLGYVNLNRLAATLSAGEAQRVKLAGLLGSGLSRMTVLLDEPSRGMHSRELEALIEVVIGLRDEGNTIIVVEHEPMFIEAADFIVDMGPGAGTEGGRVVYCGEVDGLKKQTDRSLTARWLWGEDGPRIPESRRKPNGWFTLLGAAENNLRKIDVRFPKGVVAGVCGVSGSGKSTLVVDTLARILAPVKQSTSVAYEPVEPGRNDGVDDPPERTVVVDQARAGVRTPGVFLDLERHFIDRYTGCSEAAARGYGTDVLSRSCPVCGGAGRIRLDMGFLPDVFSECDACGGTGYLPEAREISLRGLTLPELSRTTLEEIFSVWQDDQRIGPVLGQAVDLGLGYLVFHQPAPALSGGEAQRLKVVKELTKKRRVGTLYILDEPTVGQHLADVSRLTSALTKLADEGNSVLVVEHHTHLLAACDWLIELGPGSGPDGGTVVAQGTPEELAASASPTAPYLRKVLRGRIS